jgi:hypothetical protein
MYAAARQCYIPEIMNGTVSVTEAYVDDMLIVICDPGFAAAGLPNATMMCNTSQIVGPVPVCESKYFKSLWKGMYRCANSARSVEMIQN